MAVGSDTVFADGVIVIDKPAGPTSHDVVAVVRRALARAPRSGGQALSETIDDDEGRAHRDARSAGLWRAAARPGQGHAARTIPVVCRQRVRSRHRARREHDDAGSRRRDRDTRAHARRVRSRRQSLVEEAVAEFRGTYLQEPPAYSAKKIDGDRAYDLARRNAPVRLQPVKVTVTALDVLEWRGSLLRVRLVCSAGYYVRSLADAIGNRLGTGAHLAGLVRTRSGDFSISQAVGLDVIDRQPQEAAARVIPLSDLLPSLPAITLTPEGASLAARGGFIGPSHVRGTAALTGLSKGGRVRLLHPDGRLVAIAEPRAGGVARAFASGRSTGHKITRLGLTHCGGPGTMRSHRWHLLGRSRR